MSTVFDDAIQEVKEKNSGGCAYMYEKSDGSWQVSQNPICFGYLRSNMQDKDVRVFCGNTLERHLSRKEIDKNSYYDYDKPAEQEIWAANFYYWWTQRGPFRECFDEHPSWGEFLRTGIKVNTAGHSNHRMAAIIGLRMFSECGPTYLNIWREAKLAGYTDKMAFVLTHCARKEEGGNGFYLYANQSNHASFNGQFPIAFLKSFVKSRRVIGTNSELFSPSTFFSRNWTSTYPYEKRGKKLSGLISEIATEFFQGKKSTSLWDMEPAQAVSQKELHHFFFILSERIIA